MQPKHKEISEMFPKPVRKVYSVPFMTFPNATYITYSFVFGLDSSQADSPNHIIIFYTLDVHCIKDVEHLSGVSSFSMIAKDFCLAILVFL